MGWAEAAHPGQGRVLQGRLMQCSRLHRVINLDNRWSFTSCLIDGRCRMLRAEP